MPLKPPSVPSKAPPPQTAAPAPPPIDLVAPTPDPPKNFWRQPWAQDLVAFSTSVLFHGMLIVLGIVLYETIPPMLTPVREQVIIPDATMIEGAEIGGIPNPGLGGDPNLSAAQSVDPTVTVAEGWSDKRSETLTQNLMGGGGADGDAEFYSLGIRPALGSGGGTGVGRGTGTGAGSGDGGMMAPFGVPGGGAGAGPRSPFMGISGNAKYVAYVCDASGSMLNKFPSLKHELRKAIDVLRPIQAFSVIFFADPQHKPASFSQSLVLATPDKKRAANQFLDTIVTAGSTDPIPGLELAFRQKPQLIYLLTDGDFPNNKAVLDRIRQLNSDKSVKINTIVFVDYSNADKSIVDLMKQLAAENGGVFKVVSQSDL